MSDEERGDRDDDLPRAGELLRWAERTQRTIDFIPRQQAEAQARSEAGGERLREMQEENEARWARTDERWARTGEEIRELLAIAEIHEREIFESRQTRAEAGERVNALVNAVEKLISGRPNAGGGEEKAG